MHTTLVLVREWTQTHALSKHTLFETHENVQGVFLSSLDGAQSLRDIVADGAIMHIAERANVRVEFVVLDPENTAAVSGIAQFGVKTTSCSTFDEVLAALGKQHSNAHTLRVVILADAAFAEKDTPVPSRKLAPRVLYQTIRQSVSIRQHYDRLLSILKACNEDACFFLSYGSVVSNRGTWTPSDIGCAVVPKNSITFPSPANAALLPTLVLDTYSEIDSSDADLFQHQGVSTTLIETADGIGFACVCRLRLEGVQYTVKRTLPTNDVSHLRKAFLGIKGNESEWVITKDSKDPGTNMVADDAWLESSVPTELLSACRAAVLDICRRRSALEDALQVALKDVVAKPQVQAAAAMRARTRETSKVSETSVVKVDARRGAASKDEVDAADAGAADMDAADAGAADAGAADAGAADAGAADAGAADAGAADAGAADMNAADMNAADAGAADVNADAVIDMSTVHSEAGSAGGADARELSAESVGLTSANETLLALSRFFGKEIAVPIAKVLQALDEGPYTLICSKTGNVQVIVGALSPSLLLHLCTVSRTSSLPDVSGKSVPLFLSKSGVRVGSTRLDFGDVFQHQNLVAYRSSTTRSGEDMISRKDIRTRGDAAYRAYVPRLAKQLEQARALLHR
jgi:hypothetical protein